MTDSLGRKLFAEALGTAALLAVVVGSGIMGERLAQGNDAIALLANSLATGFGLFVLIVTLAQVSGAHLNPVVSLAALAERKLPARHALAYIAVQVSAGFIGVLAAHLMFDAAAFTASTKVRTGTGQWIAEAIAAFGLVLAIAGCARQSIVVTAGVVASYITAAYWFTASTSFANPAVTLARATTESFAGIRPADTPGFIFAQLAGAIAAIYVSRFLWPRSGRIAD